MMETESYLEFGASCFRSPDAAAVALVTVGLINELVCQLIHLQPFYSRSKENS